MEKNYTNTILKWLKSRKCPYTRYFIRHKLDIGCSYLSLILNGKKPICQKMYNKLVAFYEKYSTLA